MASRIKNAEKNAFSKVFQRLFGFIGGLLEFSFVKSSNILAAHRHKF